LLEKNLKIEANVDTTMVRTALQAASRDTPWREVRELMRRENSQRLIKDELTSMYERREAGTDSSNHAPCNGTLK